VVVMELLKKWMSQEPNSKSVAKQRLQAVLVYDRVSIPPKTFEDLKHELVNLFTRYFDLDKQALKIEVQNQRSRSTLVINLPFQRIRTG